MASLLVDRSASLNGSAISEAKVRICCQVLMREDAESEVYDTVRVANMSAAKLHSHGNNASSRYIQISRYT